MKTRIFSHFVFCTCSLFLACYVCILSVSAQTDTLVPRDERTGLACLIAQGTTPLNIRATAIHDTQLVAAIQQGCRTRQIYILLDQPSAEIRKLASRRNLQVRLTLKRRRGGRSAEEQPYSFVMEVGSGYYETWYGPAIWAKTAFGSTYHLYGESGTGPGETDSKDAQAFGREFARASLFKLQTPVLQPAKKRDGYHLHLMSRIATSAL